MDTCSVRTTGVEDASAAGILVGKLGGNLLKLNVGVSSSWCKEKSLARQPLDIWGPPPSRKPPVEKHTPVLVFLRGVPSVIFAGEMIQGWDLEPQGVCFWLAQT